MMSDPTPLPPLRNAPMRRPTWRFLLSHPAHLVALGFGSGLSPVAPGTAGTLWAWFVFVALFPHFDNTAWAALLAGGTLVGWWACTRTARRMGVSDPGSIVWDEVIAFWLVLWVIMPAGLVAQAAAFALFRFFDAVKPGPVAWADALFKGRPGEPVTAAQGLGIMFDDLIAAVCTLVVIALARWAGWW
jgi:phosphatidylglycerophosphatase A